ncbi:T9SS type A sorting domain-containing protein [Microvirga sp. STR05]|uniref:T9SS type A sorting domain-containing protein n=1 Tax=Hymenobacter duratus TaxID=2771356 RepID=A0ABR8JFX9_9BACT|nr:zinc-dependent metalloprotease family protein [Hymenobacter duratus]MBD2715770.1 T9SS type A sorting domain-containing protein [Hymenobacter duratus]MBR7950681.1 T9SS type A sorting domain-containing protein [Microvirga sp. STR05]
MLQTFTSSRRTWRPALLGGLLLAAAGSPLSVSAQRVLWADATEALPTAARTTTQALRQYRSVTMQLPAMRAALAAAPAEAGSGARNSSTVISLPLPDGSSQRFRIVQVPVMAPQLAAKYPQIRTYEAQGIDDPSATARLDISPAGFHAMITTASRTIFIDPVSPTDNTHLVFDRTSMNKDNVRFECLTAGSAIGAAGSVLTPPMPAAIPNGATLKTYRLAVSCTGEYAVAVCAPAAPTTALTLSKIVTSVNRVSGVYEKEIAARLVLIPKNDTLVFLNGTTDPFTNNSSTTLLTENQAVVTARIGAANYDIGHVFATGDGGVAQLRSLCASNGKARGMTGRPAPFGDAFDIDYVAHEIGHQFGGNHTFNGTIGSCSGGNRSASAAYEPGSGTTIMAYAGICGADNTQNNSDPYFHSYSFDELVAHMAAGGNCGVNTPTGNNAPVVNAGANYRIPLSTPFELTGSATDPNGDALTYSWEQFNLGPGGAPNSPTGDAPIFRAYAPVASPTRTFPATLTPTGALGALLTNTQVRGEILPSYARRLVFRFVARDNRVGGGGVDYDSMNVAVVGTAGPFLVTLPNTASASWQAGAPQQVAWDVANTTAAPISAANVDILLSTDGGRTFPTTLLANTPNDGYENVTVPASVAATTSARIKVKASGNVFFDLSNQNFSITNSGAPTFFLAPVATQIAAFCPGASSTFDLNVGQIQSFTGQVALSATSLPAGITVTYNNATTAAGTTVQATVAVAAGTAGGTYTINLTGTSGSITQTQQYTFTVLPSATAAAVPVSPVAAQVVSPRPRLTWSAVPNATAYEVQVASDASFANVLLTQTNVTGTNFTVASPALTTGTTYYWRVRGTSPCGVAPYSVISSFQIGTLSCFTAVATQIPVNIPFGATPTVTSVINVQNGERVGNIRIRNLAITHPDVSELTISLTNPAGRTAVLLANACPGTSDINLTLSEDAASAITCPLTGGATYRPANSLANLLNDAATGNWTLSIADNNPSNGGQLTGWTLELCTLAEPPAAPASLTALLNGVTNNRANVDLIWLDNATNETGYQVERTGAGNTVYTLLATLPANSTYYADQISGANGNYCYRVRAISGAATSAYSNEACVGVTTLATQNEALLRGVEVYPNPSNGLFQVKVDNAQRGTVTLRVTDALGRTVSRTALSKAGAPLQHALDLSKLSSGVYQLHLDMPEGTAVVKLLKQ